MTESKKILIFGAGRIGRSFIGQLFSLGGYEVVFADIMREMVGELNRKGRYKVIVKEDVDSVIWVENVRGVWAMDEEAVTGELRDADLVAVSTGQSGLPGVMPLLAKGLAARYEVSPQNALDVIIAENLRNAADYVGKELKNLLPPEYPFSRLVGLVETSIGKMVPFMQKKDIEDDALQIFCEAYNTLILDKKGFKNPVPAIKGLAPKENMKAWVDRKLFIHNLGHAAASYLGYIYNPDFRFIYEVLEIPELFGKVRRVMLQSAQALEHKYSDEFTRDSLTSHIDDLLKRFANHALGDTIFRVGCDLPRKLGPEDRLAGAIRLAREMKDPYDRILHALVCACRFRAAGNDGNMFPADIEFVKTYSADINKILTEVCCFDPDQDRKILKQAENILKGLSDEVL